MQIEAGKFYRTRGGWRVGPMEATERKDLDYGWRNATKGSLSFDYRDGGAIFVSGDDDEDLVAEWVDEAPNAPEAKPDEATDRALRMECLKIAVAQGWPDSYAYVRVAGCYYAFVRSGWVPDVVTPKPAKEADK